MADPILGEIRLFPYNRYAPEGWLDCSGQTLNIQQYPALYATIGAIYGGDGKTTFQLPNLNGLVAPGMGNATNQLAQTYGQAAVTLTQNQIPPHTHTMTAKHSTNNTVDVTSDPAGAMLTVEYTAAAAGGKQTTVNAVQTTANGYMSIATLASAGTGQAHSNQQPYLTMRYCIAIQGDFTPKP